MSKMTHMLLSVAIATSSLMFAAGAQAESPKSQAAKAQTTKLNAFLCKDIMRLSSDDRSVALGMLHGYFLGKKGATEYVDSDLARATDDFIEYCLDRPNDKAMEAFAKFAK